MARTTLAIFALLGSLFNADVGFYVLGQEPVGYCKNDTEKCKSDIKLYVNRLNSNQNLIPYEYDHFDFCTSNETSLPFENLGQILLGYRIHSSPYKLKFLKEEKYAVLCQKNYVGGNEDSEKKLQQLKNGIQLSYEHHWIVDNMPVTYCFDLHGDNKYCTDGLPMGCFFLDPQSLENSRVFYEPTFNKPNASYLFNHVDLTITYNNEAEEDWESSENSGRITSINVKSRSIQHDANQADLDCTSGTPLEVPEKLSPGQKFSVLYTYSVHFQKNNNIKWTSRWDYILNPTAHRAIEGYAIINSAIIALILFGFLLLKLRRLRMDVVKFQQGYLQLESNKDAKKVFGWILLHKHVFQPPSQKMLLSVLLGSGVQLFCTALAILVLANLGFVSPTYKGSLMTCAVFAYVCFGTIAGYVSARMYKSFGGENWKSNFVLTSILNPGLIFTFFFITNLGFRAKESSAAVPFSTLEVILSLWFGVYVPLTFIGTFFGVKQEPIKYPVCTIEFPCEIPQQNLYRKFGTFIGILAGGILPFGCLFLPAFFILNSIWGSQMYSNFNYLIITFFIFTFTCAQSTMLLCSFYFRLYNGNWTWNSFSTSGYTAIYLLSYCMHYFSYRLSYEDNFSFVLYCGYTVIIAYLLFLMTGTIGYFACFWFVRKIYYCLDTSHCMLEQKKI